MQGLVTLDLGNTNPHAGLFQKAEGVWSLQKVVPLFEISNHLNELEITAHNSSIVVSEVKSQIEEIQKLQEQGFLITKVKDYWRGNKFSGMPVHYATTLGEDRLIQAFYCFKKFKTNSLIIDAGTFLTLDIVNESGFQGGFIAPGLSAYFSVYQKGEQLKSLNFSSNFSFSLPKDTISAMSLSYLAFVELAKGLIIKEKVQNVFVTGGGTELWKDFLKDVQDQREIINEPNLIHHALHFWMTTQIEPL